MYGFGTNFSCPATMLMCNIFLFILSYYTGVGGGAYPPGTFFLTQWLSLLGEWFISLVSGKVSVEHWWFTLCNNDNGLCFSYYRNRVRHVDEHFDLDLTYITDRIIGKIFVDNLTIDILYIFLQRCLCNQRNKVLYRSRTVHGDNSKLLIWLQMMKRYCIPIVRLRDYSYCCCCFFHNFSIKIFSSLILI